MRWMKLMMVPALALAMLACASTPEDTTALLVATEKLEQARVASVEVQDKRVKIFRDELLARSLGEIEQGRMDDLRKLQLTGPMDPAKIEKINADAKILSDAAITHVMKAYDDTKDLQAEKDFREIYGVLRMYWITRLNADAQRQAIVDKVKDFVGVKKKE